jgi:hypothetical protein
MNCEGEGRTGHDLFYDTNLDGGPEETVEASLKTVDILAEIPNLTLHIQSRNTNHKPPPTLCTNAQEYGG